MFKLISKIIFKALSKVIETNLKDAVKVTFFYENSCYSPFKANASDSGYDCFARINNPSGFEIIQPFSHKAIPLGFSYKFKEEFIEFMGVKLISAFSCRGRSGYALKNGITAHLGTLDNAYNKEVCVILYNNTSEPFYVNDMQKICQIIPELVIDYNISYKNVDSLEKNAEKLKSRDGFGSTGV